MFNGKGWIDIREKNQVKQVHAGLECGISVKDFNDFQIKDIIESLQIKYYRKTIYSHE